MKKKRFYNNKKRNTKWTEQEKGRKISFADKYIEAGTGSDKFDSRRPKPKKKIFTAERMRFLAKSVIIAVCCFVLISTGYTFMDLYIERNAMPSNEESYDASAQMGNIQLEIKGCKVEPLSLDGGVMLEAVANYAVQGGYSSVCFDVKRDDGSIGYESRLATIDAYGAVSSASCDLEKSVSVLLENDLLPVARISCYKDNIAVNADLSCALIEDSSLYRDSQSNTYLNPDASGTYNYIKSIVEEVNRMGIDVFVLDNCNLPEDISDKYDDGFDILAKKLYVDFGDSVRFYEAQNVDIISDDPDEVKKELEEKVKPPKESRLYCISTSQPDIVSQYMNENGILSYVIIVKDTPLQNDAQQ